MTRYYTSTDHQSIYDVCLNTYGTLDLIVKLINDNGFPGLDTYPISGSIFVYDDSLTVNQSTVSTSGVLTVYATRADGKYDVGYKVNDINNPVVTIPPTYTIGATLYDGIVDDGVNYDLQYYDDF